MSKILGIGNALVDVIVTIDNENIFSQFGLKKGGMEMIDVECKRTLHQYIANLSAKIASGGSTANTMHGIARLGHEAGYIGKIADDEFGNFFLSDLQNSGITPHLFISKEEETGIATTLMTSDGERTFATYLGAASSLLPEDIIGKIFEQYQHIHVEGYLVFNHDLITTICKVAKEKGLTVSMDMASYNVVELNLGFLKELLAQYVDIIFANEEEAKAFTNKEDYEALEILSQYCDTAIVKLGAKGSIVKHQNQVIDIPAVPANCIDTNGAGDIYAAGFLHGLFSHYPIEECGKIGSTLSALLVETVGAKLSNETWEKVIAGC
jgi:sugar/nucleoside kinase (ribokinase family)